MKNKKDKKSLKRPLAAALLSCFFTLWIGLSAFVYFFLDCGSERVVVEIPNFVGIDIAEIDGQNYENFVIEKEPIYSSNEKKGTIIAQTPEAYSKRVIRGKTGDPITVKVKVSLGKEELFMPDLCGFDCYEAACCLRELGVTVRFVYVYDGGVEYDKVLQSSPKSGEPIEKGERVTLTVSRHHIKHPVSVKDFRMMSQEQAIRELMGDGLVLGRVIIIPSTDEYDGVVISQSIPGGSTVKWGTKIDITVAKKGEAAGFYNGTDSEINDTEIIINGENY